MKLKGIEFVTFNPFAFGGIPRELEPPGEER